MNLYLTSHRNNIQRLTKSTAVTNKPLYITDLHNTFIVYIRKTLRNTYRNSLNHILLDNRLKLPQLAARTQS